MRTLCGHVAIRSQLLLLARDALASPLSVAMVRSADVSARPGGHVDARAGESRTNVPSGVLPSRAHDCGHASCWRAADDLIKSLAASTLHGVAQSPQS